MRTQIRSPWGPDPGPAEHLPPLQSTLPPGTRGRQRRKAAVPQGHRPLGPARPRGRRGREPLLGVSGAGEGAAATLSRGEEGPQPGRASLEGARAVDPSEGAGDRQGAAASPPKTPPPLFSCELTNLDLHALEDPEPPLPPPPCWVRRDPRAESRGAAGASGGAVPAGPD